MPIKQTTGSYYNVACPHCGKTNHFVTDGQNLELDIIRAFSKPCFYCRAMVFYHASYEVKVEAFSEDPIENMRKAGEPCK